MSIVLVLIIVLVISVCVLIICKKLSAKIAARRLEELCNIVDEKRIAVEAALSELSYKFTYSHYITESERLTLREKLNYFPGGFFNYYLQNAYPTTIGTRY